MSCGTGRISQGEKLETKKEKEWAAKRALNTPQIWDQATVEEVEEIFDYAADKDINR